MNDAHLKTTLRVSATANCLFFLIASLNFILFKNQTSNTTQKPTYTIAITRAGPTPCSEASYRSFMSTLNKSAKANYQFTNYNAYNDRIKMRTQAEEIVKSNPDLIHPIGALCPQMAKEITLKRKKLIPIVFTAVKGPVEVDLVESEAYSGNHLTGVTGLSLPFEQRLGIMLVIKPTIKKALIAYSPTIHFVESDKQQVEAILHNKGIQVEAVQVYQTNEITQKITPFLHGPDKPDVLITLRDNVVSSSYTALVKLCNNAGVTIFSAHLDGIEKGGAFGIGSFDDAYGTASAHLARQVLEEGKAPSQIPITQLFEGFIKLAINTKTMKQQNLKIDPNLLFVIKNTVFL
jgi:ABC-type uncharacterized transport system substrate-binding protein